MGARTVRRLLVVLTLTVAIAALGLGGAPTATSASRWAPAATATIHPGVNVTSATDASCTTNFVFYDGDDVFIGEAAHCSGLGSADQTDGCTTPSLPLGSPVTIQGASKPGTLVYSSWVAMQAAGETDAAACAYNDFAVIKIDPADRARVNPSIPHWGGPIGINRHGLSSASAVYSSGNSILRGGLELLQPKSGLALEEFGGGWGHMVYLVLPGIPGDSGSALVDAQGVAAGIASTIVFTPIPAANIFADLGRALDYAKAHGMPGLKLAVGTEPFNPNQLPLGGL